MHHITINVRNGKVTTATCKCGQSFGRGKTAARGAKFHIDGWGATYETIHNA